MKTLLASLALMAALAPIARAEPPPVSPSASFMARQGPIDRNQMARIAGEKAFHMRLMAERSNMIRNAAPPPAVAKPAKP